MSGPQALRWVVTSDASPRLDVWLASQRPEVSRSAWRHRIAAGQVTLDGAAAKPGQRLRLGQRVVVTQIETVEDDARFQPFAMDLDVVYEDCHLAVVNKPARLVMHPSPGHTDRTLAQALMHRWPELSTGEWESLRPGIVHRLDRDTSGLVAVARSPQALRGMQAQFKARRVRKTYLALVDGFLEQEAGVINVALGRHPRYRQRQAAFPQGAASESSPSQVRPAITRFRTLRHLQGRKPGNSSAFTLVEAYPLTGRTHQIRVHLAYLSHPVAGDEVYGLRRPRIDLPRQFLHASALRFTHPCAPTVLNCYAPLPQELQDALLTLAPAD